MNIQRIIGVPIAAIGIGLFGLAPSVSAADGDWVVDGNPTCASLEIGGTEIKNDPPSNTTIGGITFQYSADYRTVTVTSDGSVTILAIIIKGGNAATVITTPPFTGSAPAVSSGLPEISHVSVCVGPPATTTTTQPATTTTTQPETTTTTTQPATTTTTTQPATTTTTQPETTTTTQPATTTTTQPETTTTTTQPATTTTTQPETTTTTQPATTTTTQPETTTTTTLVDQGGPTTTTTTTTTTTASDPTTTTLADQAGPTTTTPVGSRLPATGADIGSNLSAAGAALTLMGLALIALGRPRTA